MGRLYHRCAAISVHRAALGRRRQAADCAQDSVIARGNTLGSERDETVGFSYGYDRARFIRSAYIGVTIQAAVAIIRKRDHLECPDHGYVIERVEALNQHGKIVLATQHLCLAQRKEFADGDKA